MKRVREGDHRNGTKYEVNNDTSLGQLFRVTYTSGINTIRKSKQISMTLEDKFRCTER